MNFFGLISRQRIAADIHYRNTSKGLFANVTSILSWTNSPYTRYQLIEGDDAYYGYNAKRSTGRMFTFTWGLSKTLRLISGGFYLDGLFTRNRNKIISQSNISLSSYDMLSVNGKLYSSPCRLLYLQYQFKLNYSALHYKYVNKSADISNIIQATIYPSSKLYFDLTGELLETGIYTDSKNFVPMVDAALTVKLSKAVELKASTTNIFNRNAYSSTNYGILSTVRTTTFMRGREFLVSIYLNR